MRRVTSSSLVCWLLSFAVLFPLGGCSTITSEDIYNEDLQEKVRHGQLIEKGDYVIIHTLDNKKYEFAVDGIDEKSIKGNGISVQIDNIASLKTKTVSVEKTAGLVGGVGLGLWFVYLSVLTGTLGLVMLL
jgi:hypothetical protein